MSETKADAAIDITDVVCPITFVKVKVALEDLADGTIFRRLAVFELAADSNPFIFIIIVLLFCAVEHEVTIVFFYIAEGGIYKRFHIFNFTIFLDFCKFYGIMESTFGGIK